MISPRLRLLLVLAPVAVLSLSCTSTDCGCVLPPARDHAEVYGTVRTTSGAPVPGAAVSIVAYRSECAGHAERVDDGIPLRTDAQGSYDRRVYSVASGPVACLRVTATRGEGASADSVVVEGATVAFRGEEMAPERVRVDLLFP
jgi:hypothetical protein